MFTGIVEEIGRVAALTRGEGSVRLSVECAVVHDGARLGDSIAVNGVCLTVVLIDPPRDGVARLAFDAIPETLRRSNLGRLEVGAPVNLERPVSGGRPMGGHYVQGHVDGVAVVRRATPDGDALDVWFDAPAELLRFVVEKGYVTIDGASLTVIATDGAGFAVSLVPHTRQNVVFGDAKPGMVVNLEVDVMAKYVERMMGPRLAALEARLAALEDPSPGQ